MAYHFINRGADAFGVTFKIQRCRCGVIFCGLLKDPVINLLRGDAFLNTLGHIIQDSNIHFGALPDGMDLGLGFNHVLGGDYMSLAAVQCDFLVKIIMAFFVL